MKINFSQIYEGWTNHLIPDKEIKELIKDTSADRLEKCKTCKFNTTPDKVNLLSRCDACGCLLIPKSKCLSCNCGLEHYNTQHPDNQLPLLWEAVLQEEENNKIHTSIKID